MTLPLTSYCKKCGRDVPVASFCPHCHAKLAANTVRLAWCVDHSPVRDWMCWNAVMRLLLPVLGATLALILLLEGVLGGLVAVASLLSGGLVASLIGLLGMVLAVMLLVFILQGDDLLDCVVDSRGVHVLQYLPEPTKIKLLLRGKSPSLMDSLGEDNLVLISQKDIAWKDIQRVQLWPEKTTILFYAPRWWMRVALPCTAFTWEDTLDFIREKIGKKKAVILPEECRQTAPAKPKGLKGKKEQQLTFADVRDTELIPSQPIPEEDVPPLPTEPPSPDVTDELEGDFTSLADVLQEIKDAQKA